MEEQQDSGYDSTKKQTDYSEQQARKSADDFNESWNEATHGEENKKMLAGILAIVIGSLGVHKFILGYTQEGIIQIVITIVTCGIGGIIPLIEGIIYLTKSDEEFYQTYQVGKKGWF
ncbi:TM2 domain-containing protein [Aequorivita sp. F47161]|uniref:TM2 domain-containing protein n=1 Tax=Aequorivita vitellina TaxID=2874475 RepID=A0A9X1U1P2_9FLAO|nr:TM2 domain-containing protein [Aequorivita vitellina]MCG2417422.1 TM2 domain-containing protein [Aequorivita vitellina]MCZ4317687.1 TM2 domain-containing protein [Aequorivita viscosa]